MHIFIELDSNQKNIFSFWFIWFIKCSIADVIKYCSYLQSWEQGSSLSLFDLESRKHVLDMKNSKIVLVCFCIHSNTKLVLVQWSVECSRGDVLVLDRCRSLPLYMLIDPKESQSVEFVVKEEWSKYRTNNWRNSQHTHTFRREPFLICICFYYYFRRVFWRNRRMMAVGEILQQKGSEKENCLLWCCFYEYIFAVASFFICIFIFLLLFLFHFLFRSIFAEIHMFCGGGNGIKKFFILFSFPLFFSFICHHIGIVILEYVFLLLYQKFADISLEYCFLLWPQKPTKKNYG